MENDALPEVNVDPEFAALIPSLTDAEFTQLKANILRDGCLSPLTVWSQHWACADCNGETFSRHLVHCPECAHHYPPEDGECGNCHREFTAADIDTSPLEPILLDGHNRLKICREAEIPFTTQHVYLSSRSAARFWIIRTQLGRRNLAPAQRIELALLLEPEIAEKAKGKQRASGGAVVQKSAEPPVIVREEVARLADVSHDSVDKYKAIRERVTPETKQRLMRGETTINAEFKELQKERREGTLKQHKADIDSGAVVMPEGVFEVIAVDPPWPYGTAYDPQGRRAASPYPEMSLEQIGALALPAAGDCVLWLWTTHAFMRHAFPILDGWGFREVAILTWEKDRIGLGAWLRSQTEFCIMAVKGNPKVILTNQSTILHGEMREHSRKPEAFYTLVEDLCVGRRLDYFSREARKGWAQFGSEASKFNRVE